jgi:hypothetical protein
MRSKILAVLVVVVAMMGVSPAAMAKVGGGGGGGGKGGWSHGGMHGHGHFDHRFARRDFFNRRLFNSFGWGWGGDWGWGGYGDSGYGGNNTVVVFPQAIPQAATGSVDPGPCKWNQQEFKVPSSAGGTRPVQVVSCH